jgi:protein ImuA
VRTTGGGYAKKAPYRNLELTRKMYECTLLEVLFLLQPRHPGQAGVGRSRLPPRWEGTADVAWNGLYSAMPDNRSSSKTTEDFRAAAASPGAAGTRGENAPKTARPQVEVLREQLTRFETARRPASPADKSDPFEVEERYLRTGWQAIDALLPWGGFPRGTLVEWLGGEGSGVGLLALGAARAAAGGSLPVVIVDPDRQFYPPAAAAWGLEEENLFLVHPSQPQDTLWVWDQALRCRGVAAVWGRLDQLAPRPFRRLQLAAEEGESLGCLVRPLHVQGRPSWAEVQLTVHPLPTRSPPPSSPGRLASPSPPTSPPHHSPMTPLSGRRWRIELTRYRGLTRDGVGVGVSELELDERGQEIPHSAQEKPRHATHSVPLVSALAPPATARRQARA